MRYLATDIETVPHECVREFVTPPDLSQVQAAKNLKDPAKIAEDIAKRQADVTQEYEARLSRAALDWNVSRIVALAWHDGFELTVRLCHIEEEERESLADYWAALRNHMMLGFCVRNFDAPTLIQRSRLLDVRHPYISLARYGRGDVVDLRDILTFDDARYDAIMPRSLKAFAKRFGLDVTDDVDGADIHRLVQEGRWEAVEAHVTSDIELTIGLAQKLGYRLSGATLEPAEQVL